MFRLRTGARAEHAEGLVADAATAAARETYSAVKGAAKEDLDYSAVMKFWKP